MAEVLASLCISNTGVYVQWRKTKRTGRRVCVRAEPMCVHVCVCVCVPVQMYIEQFVVENLNEHRKGILGRTMPVSHMLSWTKVRHSSFHDRLSLKHDRSFVQLPVLLCFFGQRAE